MKSEVENAQVAITLNLKMPEGLSGDSGLSRYEILRMKGSVTLEMAESIFRAATSVSGDSHREAVEAERARMHQSLSDALEAYKHEKQNMLLQLHVMATNEDKAIAERAAMTLSTVVGEISAVESLVKKALGFE